MEKLILMRKFSTSWMSVFVLVSPVIVILAMWMTYFWPLGTDPYLHFNHGPFAKTKISNGEIKWNQEKSSLIDAAVESYMQKGRYDLALDALKGTQRGDPKIRWNYFLVSLPYGLLLTHHNQKAIQAVDFILENLKAGSDSVPRLVVDPAHFSSQPHAIAAFFKSVAYAKLDRTEEAKRYFYQFSLGFSDDIQSQKIRSRTELLLERWKRQEVDLILLTPLI
jgi:tetratricopeptide (TPR) repeat protein